MLSCPSLPTPTSKLPVETSLPVSANQRSNTRRVTYRFVSTKSRRDFMQIARVGGVGVSRALRTPRARGAKFGVHVARRCTDSNWRQIVARSGSGLRETQTTNKRRTMPLNLWQTTIERNGRLSSGTTGSGNRTAVGHVMTRCCQ